MDYFALNALREKISSIIADREDVLIVGGTGTLGKALLEILAPQKKKYQITVLSREELKQQQLKSVYREICAGRH
jgi:FlaA1/EpsC-like NDP-sugar epimerase